jgi:P-type Cu+ transporter
VERDPVWGMQVDPRDAPASMEYRGKTYYFCSEDCHQTFMQNPAPYAGQAARR